MGEVYRAKDTRLDRTVAIKILTGTLSADAESRARFEQEACAIAALNDPRWPGRAIDSMCCCAATTARTAIWRRSR
jgi:serine/threonine protein kinase